MWPSLFEIWVLQPPPLQKELLQFSFLGIYRTATLHQITSGWLHCYEVTLVEKCNKALLQKSETKVFDQKRFVKYLLKVSEKNNSGVSRINEMMSKLLILSKRLK